MIAVGDYVSIIWASFDLLIGRVNRIGTTAATLSLLIRLEGGFLDNSFACNIRDIQTGKDRITQFSNSQIKVLVQCNPGMAKFFPDIAGIEPFKSNYLTLEEWL